MYSFDDLGRAHGEVSAWGQIKLSNDDFQVDEIMPVEPCGEGEHLWLQVRKNGCNTDWVARQLADASNVRPMAVGFAGLKDRHAVTTQWFSIHLPGRADPDLSSIQSDDIQILKSLRHDRKLRRGALSGNHFCIRVRHLSGSRDELEQRLNTIVEQGVPNYFGEQRFGHGMSNLARAEALFSGRMKRVKKAQRSIYLSAARSWVFNAIVSERVHHGTWNHTLAGDVLQLAGKTACFADDGSDDIAQRIEDQQIHPTAALWGKGESMAQGACLALETRVAAKYESLCHGLEHAGLKQERRSLRLVLEKPGWEFDQDSLQLVFELPAGAYATMVLRELVSVTGP